jgi:hypothetical protein
MKTVQEGKLLRIFVGEADKFEQMPLNEVLVLKAREQGLAGATVSRGVKGYGAASRVIHNETPLRLSDGSPVIVEIIDTEEKIKEFLPVVDELFEKVGCGGMVTVEHASVVKYTQGR